MKAGMTGFPPAFNYLLGLSEESVHFRKKKTQQFLNACYRKKTFTLKFVFLTITIYQNKAKW
jgi:hypothetical protein